MINLLIGDYMRVYFIFEIKDEFKKLYKGRELNLYKVLKNIYKLNNKEVEYGYQLLKQITNPIKKEDLDRDLYVKLHREYPYSKKNNIHYYNQLYKNEISRLKVKNTYIKLETEQKESSFFNILKNYSSNYFVCDFEIPNYFYL